MEIAAGASRPRDNQATAKLRQAVGNQGDNAGSRYGGGAA